MAGVLLATLAGAAAAVGGGGRSYAVGTTGTWAQRRELTMLLHSVALYSPARSATRVYVYCDMNAAEWLYLLFRNSLQLKVMPALPSAWVPTPEEALHAKLLVIHRSLADSLAEGVLYLDADMVLLAPLPAAAGSGALGVDDRSAPSPRVFLVGNGQAAAQLQRAAVAKRGAPPEQALALACATAGGGCFHLPAALNVGPRGLSPEDYETTEWDVTAGPEGALHWRGQPVVGAHNMLFSPATHLGRRRFDLSLQVALRVSRHPANRLLRALSARPVIHFPSQPREHLKWNHVNDSGRESVLSWGRLGLVTIEPSSSVNHMYWRNARPGSTDRVLLYDRDHSFWRQRDDHRDFGLWAQSRPPGLPNTKDWTYWARHPMLVHGAVRFAWARDRRLGIPKLGQLPGYAQRPRRSIFYGTMAFKRQAATRTAQNWSLAVDEWVVPRFGVNTGSLSEKEYTHRTLQARFGLSLRGLGAKCNRDIEYLALGVVPVAEQASDMEGYAEPLVEGVHFLRAATPEEARQQILMHDTPAAWDRLSRAGHEWYLRNAAPLGMFLLTERLVAEFRPRGDPSLLALTGAAGGADGASGGGAG